VIVHEGAIVRDSVIMTDSVIESGAIVDRCIVDKEVLIGAGARLGVGGVDVPNLLEPERLNTGITLVGRSARVPAHVTIGRNVLIAPNVLERHFLSRDIPSGDAVDIQAPALSY
jgi:glucose-1-phosphate adenylyltransferase